MKKAIFTALAAFAVVMVTTCKKPFSPAVENADNNFLVVEGLINSGTDSTIIHISRTSGISALFPTDSTANSEKKAAVTVEDDQNASYPLKETLNGRYVSAALGLNAARSYRLRIKTADGQTYLSDYETVKPSPPIDSVGFKTDNNQLTIYANTHDPANNTRYYRYDFEETWMFNTTYNSQYVPTTCDYGYDERKAVVPIPLPPGRLQSIYTCYSNDISTSIVLASTAKLDKDILYQAPLAVIAGSSEKLSIRYSILVKQYALTKAAYEFWGSVKTNTENLGSIFDAQPSAPQGNLHCISNPAIPAIGYVSVGTVQRKRIFIDKTDLRSFVYTSKYTCGLDTELFVNKGVCYPTPGHNIIDLLYYGSVPVGIIQAETACSDCTTRGVLKRPSFWK